MNNNEGKNRFNLILWWAISLWYFCCCLIHYEYSFFNFKPASCWQIWKYFTTRLVEHKHEKYSSRLKVLIILNQCSDCSSEVRNIFFLFFVWQQQHIKNKYVAFSCNLRRIMYYRFGTLGSQSWSSAKTILCWCPDPTTVFHVLSYCITPKKSKLCSGEVDRISLDVN